MNLSASYPLKKDFWENPSFEYKDFNRMVSFINVITSPENYKNTCHTHGCFHKCLYYPDYIFKTAVELDIELFMKSSDWYVDPTAKNYALYEIEGLVGIDVLTREVVKKDLDEDQFHFPN